MFISTFWIWLFFCVGLILIVRGGDRFVDAAAWMAAASGIPPFVIGATVVSVATTLPELIVSLIAAMNGQAEMAAGNAIGSVTANTALILGLSIVFLPGKIERIRFLPKTVLLILSVLLLWMTGLSGYLTPIGSMGLLLLFGIFLYENIRSAKEERQDDTPCVAPDRRSAVKNLFLFVLGAAMIILGSRLLVDNGTVIARDLLKIDERIVSLTMVAVGTSLPELVTAVSAIAKGRGAITLGNILGANIIDTLLILPACSLVQGGVLTLSRGTLWVDLPVCFAAVLITLVPALVKGRFYRVQGMAAMGLYILYTVLLFVTGV